MAVTGLLGCLACASSASAASVASVASSHTHLSIFAGTGAAGAPTSGSAISSALHHPRGVAVDSTGDLYIADYLNSEVEKVTPLGTLSIVAGTGTYGTPTRGAATKSALGNPTGVAVNSAGDVFIADPYENVVEEVNPKGTLSIIAGSGNAGKPTRGPATRSALDEPYGVAVDPTTGDLYIADYDNSEVEKVTPKGALSVVAGNGTYGTPTPGRATSSELRNPSDVAVNGTGDLFIADPYNNVVEEVTPKGVLSIIAGTGIPGAPTAGPAIQSGLDYPHGLAVDPATDDLYIADYENSTVEQVTPGGTLSIVAGTGVAGTPTPGPATHSELNEPLGVGVDPGTGDLYIADTSNNQIERVGPACPPPSGSLSATHLGPITLGMTSAQARKALPVYTVAGNRLQSFCLAGGPAIVAGYPSTRLLKPLSAHQRARLRGRVVVALTANPHYALDHITAGTPVAQVHGRLTHASQFQTGGNTWYVLSGRKATRVVKVQHGTVEEVGIASRALTATLTQQRRLLAGF